MALIANKPLAGGIVATYHKVGVITLDYVQGKTTVSVRSYLDADQRAVGMDNNLTGDSIQFDDFPPPAVDLRTWAYEQLKATPEFTGATDA